MSIASHRPPHGDPPSVPEPHELGATDDSLARMLEWFDRVGYSADIDRLGREFGIRPMTLPEWASKLPRS